MRVCCGLLVGIAMLLAPGAFVFAGPERDVEEASRDVRQTMQARKLLHDEPDLTLLNIGVTVQNRVAILFGPVPSADAIFRAELCLRTMIGLVEIRNDLFVSEALEPARPPAKLPAPPLNLPDVAPPQRPRELQSIFSRPEVRLGQVIKPPTQPEASCAIARLPDVDGVILIDATPLR